MADNSDLRRYDDDADDDMNDDDFHPDDHHQQKRKKREVNNSNLTPKKKEKEKKKNEKKEKRTINQSTSQHQYDTQIMKRKMEQEAELRRLKEVDENEELDNVRFLFHENIQKVMCFMNQQNAKNKTIIARIAQLQSDSRILTTCRSSEPIKIVIIGKPGQKKSVILGKIVKKWKSWLQFFKDLPNGEERAQNTWGLSPVSVSDSYHSHTQFVTHFRSTGPEERQRPNTMTVTLHFCSSEEFRHRRQVLLKECSSHWARRGLIYSDDLESPCLIFKRSAKTSLVKLFEATRNFLADELITRLSPSQCLAMQYVEVVGPFDLEPDLVLIDTPGIGHLDKMLNSYSIPARVLRQTVLDAPVIITTSDRGVTDEDAATYSKCGLFDQHKIWVQVIQKDQLNKKQPLGAEFPSPNLADELCLARTAFMILLEKLATHPKVECAQFEPTDHQGRLNFFRSLGASAQIVRVLDLVGWYRDEFLSSLRRLVNYPKVVHFLNALSSMLVSCQLCYTSCLRQTREAITQLKKFTSIKPCPFLSLTCLSETVRSKTCDFLTRRWSRKERHSVSLANLDLQAVFLRSSPVNRKIVRPFFRLLSHAFSAPTSPYYLHFQAQVKMTVNELHHQLLNRKSCGISVLLDEVESAVKLRMMGQEENENGDFHGIEDFRSTHLSECFVSHLQSLLDRPSDLSVSRVLSSFCEVMWLKDMQLVQELFLEVLNQQANFLGTNDPLSSGEEEQDDDDALEKPNIRMNDLKEWMKRVKRCRSTLHKSWKTLLFNSSSSSSSDRKVPSGPEDSVTVRYDPFCLSVDRVKLLYNFLLHWNNSERVKLFVTHPVCSFPFWGTSATPPFPAEESESEPEGFPIFVLSHHFPEQDPDYFSRLLLHLSSLVIKGVDKIPTSLQRKVIIFCSPGQYQLHNSALSSLLSPPASRRSSSGSTQFTFHQLISCSLVVVEPVLLDQNEGDEEEETNEADVFSTRRTRSQTSSSVKMTRTSQLVQARPELSCFDFLPFALNYARLHFPQMQWVGILNPNVHSFQEWNESCDQALPSSLGHVCEGIDSIFRQLEVRCVEQTMNCLREQYLAYRNDCQRVAQPLHDFVTRLFPPPLLPSYSQLKNLLRKFRDQVHSAPPDMQDLFAELSDHLHLFRGIGKICVPCHPRHARIFRSTFQLVSGTTGQIVNPDEEQNNEDEDEEPAEEEHVAVNTPFHISSQCQQACWPGLSLINLGFLENTARGSLTDQPIQSLRFDRKLSPNKFPKHLVREMTSRKQFLALIGQSFRVFHCQLFDIHLRSLFLHHWSQKAVPASREGILVPLSDRKRRDYELAALSLTSSWGISSHSISSRSLRVEELSSDQDDEEEEQDWSSVPSFMNRPFSPLLDDSSESAADEMESDLHGTQQKHKKRRIISSPVEEEEAHSIIPPLPPLLVFENHLPVLPSRGHSSLPEPKNREEMIDDSESAAAHLDLWFRQVWGNRRGKGPGDWCFVFEAQEWDDETRSISKVAFWKNVLNQPDLPQMNRLEDLDVILAKYFGYRNLESRDQVVSFLLSTKQHYRFDSLNKCKLRRGQLIFIILFFEKTNPSLKEIL